MPAPLTGVISSNTQENALWDDGDHSELLLLAMRGCLVPD